jgi:hypothetical protein
VVFRGLTGLVWDSETIPKPRVARSIRVGGTSFQQLRGDNSGIYNRLFLIARALGNTRHRGEVPPGNLIGPTL